MHALIMHDIVKVVKFSQTISSKSIRMAQEQVSVNITKKMKNKALVEEFSKSVLRHSVEHKLLHEYEDGVFLSQSDSQECDELQMKMKLIDDKLNHYRSQKKRAATRIRMIKRHKNLRDDVVKTVSSNIFNLIPSGMLESILSSSETKVQDISTMLQRLASAKACSAKSLGLEVSDSDESIVEEVEFMKEICKKKAPKRKRKMRRIESSLIQSDCESDIEIVNQNNS